MYLGSGLLGFPADVVAEGRLRQGAQATRGLAGSPAPGARWVPADRGQAVVRRPKRVAEEAGGHGGVGDDGAGAAGEAQGAEGELTTRQMAGEWRVGGGAAVAAADDGPRRRRRLGSAGEEGVPVQLEEGAGGGAHRPLAAQAIRQVVEVEGAGQEDGEDRACR